MSGIAGVYLLDGKAVERKDLERMKDSIAHRGPDGSGLWLEASVGLAHQMLWTTPESLHEKLPLEEDWLVITSDARVDNREELLPELGLSSEVPDSLVILRAYRRWGKGCVDHLLGDFAFVIWDKASDELFCARDHMGVKPFYYYYEPGKIFAFGTEIKALLAMPGVPREINEVRIADYLVPMMEDKEITFYLGILRLPPAHIMEINSDGLRKEVYWALDADREIRFDSDEEYAHAFREIFTEAVRCRLRCAFPVGSMLSGGLDSSSIVCVARELLPEDKRLKTFSAIFDIVKECDERPYINAVLAQGGLDPYFVHADEIGPLTNIDEMLWHEDQPFLAPNLFMHWALYSVANQQKVRVILDGVDGDTTVSHGRAYLTELARRGRLISLAREVKGYSRNFGTSPWTVLMRRAILPNFPETMRERMHAFRRRGVASIASYQIFNQDFAARIDLKSRQVKLQRGRYRLMQTSRGDHWYRLTRGLLPFYLEVADMAAAAFSIEPRNPFFDKRLLEFCLAMPPDQKIRQGWTRWIMRRALENILPKEIVYRGGKSNLGPNFRHGLVTLNRSVLVSFMNDMKIIEHHVDICALRESYKRYVLYEKKRSDDEIAIWRSITLAIWMTYLCN
jgi:asparagine synthase (glutamine-hydrolysing)